MSKIYLAAPFFNKEQSDLVTQLESAIRDAGFELFSPRLATNAIEMNSVIKEGKPPSKELRMRVFNDNWSNIDTSDLMLAVIDNFDVGVMWEVGYAYKAQIPIFTFTNKNYGCNLMLAHSIVGHLKSLDSLKDVLSYGTSAFSLEAPIEEHAEVLAKIQAKYKSDFALKEGPDERNQAA